MKPSWALGVPALLFNPHLLKPRLTSTTLVPFSFGVSLYIMRPNTRKKAALLLRGYWGTEKRSSTFTVGLGFSIGE